MSKDYKKDIFSILADGVELFHWTTAKDKTGNTNKQHFEEYLKLNEGVQIAPFFRFRFPF